MADRIDELFRRLRATPVDERLDRLESAVWSRIDKQGRIDAFGGKTWQVQLAVTCGSLLLGIFIAQLTGMPMMPEPLSSEIVVLSDDSAMAPSVLLEGGF